MNHQAGGPGLGREFMKNSMETTYLDTARSSSADELFSEQKKETSKNFHGESNDAF
jgi:hypothetical protein